MGKSRAARYSVGSTYAIGGIVYQAYRAEHGKVYLRPHMIEWTNPQYDTLRANWENIKKKELIRAEWRGEPRQKRKTRKFDIRDV